MISLLGFARKAGKLNLGSTAVEKSIKADKARLVIITKDTSNNTKDKFYTKASAKNIPIIEEYSRKELGNALGKGDVSVVSTADEGFAKAILKKWDGGNIE
ncbi:ribosomal L7Ae/L30e/S12e/Gadd45 family protein [Proteinivorax hydrogeniformans]|uniref:Ribosomal L7Ae/L30e/S12e/Gadd45 family protein n=1 Tax=Proteinivorax hydrogeniformans TaxID=1826727 RepID=A0AAU8HNW5_9FIRM